MSINKLTRDVRQKSNGKVTFLGGFDPKNQELVMVPMEELDSHGFCEKLVWMRNEFLVKPYYNLIFVMDNASIHNSAYT